MKLYCYPYQLKFRHPFGIAHGTRTHTDVVYVKLVQENYVAWGEASLPPYLKDTQESVMLALHEFQREVGHENWESWQCLSEKMISNMPARAALDMALWQMRVEMAGKKEIDMIKVDGNGSSHKKPSFFTIGLGEKSEISHKVKEGLAFGFQFFKIKLRGDEGDYEIIEEFEKCAAPFSFGVDINGGRKEHAEAEDFLHFLSAKKCLFAEQPMAIGKQNKRFSGLGEKLKVIADESFQGIEDLQRISENYDGINIKLMKCGGLTQGIRIAEKASAMDLKILVGSMSESTIGCSAAANLSSWAEWLDLDGPFLVVNDPFAEGSVHHFQ